MGLPILIHADFWAEDLAKHAQSFVYLLDLNAFVNILQEDHGSSEPGRILLTIYVGDDSDGFLEENSMIRCIFCGVGC